MGGGKAGYTVDSEELRSYANKLGGQQDTASGLAHLVDVADVSEQSWGVVGLFVKDEYTRMLGDLKEMFDSMVNGFESGSEKFSEAAKGYEEREAAVSRLLGDIKAEIDGASTGQ